MEGVSPHDDRSPCVADGNRRRLEFHRIERRLLKDQPVDLERSGGPGEQSNPFAPTPIAWIAKDMAIVDSDRLRGYDGPSQIDECPRRSEVCGLRSFRAGRTLVRILGCNSAAIPGLSVSLVQHV